MRNRLGFSVELTVVTQQIDGADLCLLDGFAREFGIGSNGGVACRRDPFRSFGLDAAIDADDRASFKLQFAPPDDIGEITERTNHGDTRTLFRIG
ncbi:unannotated protein [freshwater metagenome]|uniref:Unannotated protein n=1 Tax=freshwater metagenome TaxID=449393 RepID=A0A6J7M3B5_9ZZZZ